MWSFLWYNMIIKIQPGRRLTYNNDFLENLSSFKIAVYVFIQINNGDEDYETMVHRYVTNADELYRD